MLALAGFLVIVALALMLFYPDSRFSQSAPAGDQRIAASAELEEGVIVEPGAVIGAEARIGRGTRIAAGAVVGYRVSIGRDSYIGPLATVVHALIGDRVIIHSGVRIGQDGFGFAMRASQAVSRAHCVRGRPGVPPTLAPGGTFLVGWLVPAIWAPAPTLMWPGVPD
jgi:UDP-3-O-[3-hydroxymyristoyl] glucosamine N-acyltransferase